MLCNYPKREEVDVLIVSLAALLHDIADPKFHNGDETVGPKMAHDFLNDLGLDQKKHHPCGTNY